MMLRRCCVIWMLIACTFTAGCISPGVTKLAKKPEKPSQDEFSCGESTPPRLKSVPRQQVVPAQ